jgi:putative membrane protein
MQSRGGAGPARGGCRPGSGASDVPVTCLAVFLTVWILLAIAPRYRADWLLENLPTFVAVPLAIVSYRRFRFSDRAYVQATVFLVLHTIGSHYTYSEVPLGDWARDALGLARNHYDRLVHFAFGVLMLRPVYELGLRTGARPGTATTLLFAVSGAAAWSLVYEVVEWAVATIVDPAAGTAFLGIQGDPWDAQKDMALALAGASIAAAGEWARRTGERPVRAPVVLFRARRHALSPRTRAE